MASSSAPVHPARYLSVFLVMLIGIYLLVFFTGDKHTAPKLGIDLQGGTRVTMAQPNSRQCFSLRIPELVARNHFRLARSPAQAGQAQ